MAKQYPTLDYERQLLCDGHCYIAGIDEAGRGAWAGPVVAATVILPLDDPDVEQELRALAWATATIPAVTIDQVGIVPSTRLAMCQCVSQLDPGPDALLIDALNLPSIQLTQRALVKGDRKSLVIAAASILAKTSRDHEMIALDPRFPGYGFAQHKGYGTPQHLQALCTLGPTEVHRWSFAPVAAVGHVPAMQPRDLLEHKRS
jgi:ribonuclease HII